MSTSISFKLPVAFKKKSHYYVVSCSVLDVVTQGKTLKEAENNIIEAIYFFLLFCYEHGTLDKVLKRRGFKPLDKISHKRTKSVPKITNIPKNNKNKRIVDVPLDFPCNYTLAKAA